MRVLLLENEECESGAFWIDAHGYLCYWEGHRDYQREIDADGGCTATEDEAATFGTTLADIRAKLS